MILGRIPGKNLIKAGKISIIVSILA